MSESDIIGTLGVTILLLAFLLQILKVLSLESSTYSILNGLGAALAGYSSWLIDFKPFVILEAVWVLVSIYNLYKNLKLKSST